MAGGLFFVVVFSPSPVRSITRTIITGEKAFEGIVPKCFLSWSSCFLRKGRPEVGMLMLVSCP